jgi:hypothetical protein
MNIGGLYSYAVHRNVYATQHELQVIAEIKADTPFVLLLPLSASLVPPPSIHLGWFRVQVLTSEGIVGWIDCLMRELKEAKNDNFQAG